MQHGLSVTVHDHIDSCISSVSSLLEGNEAENSRMGIEVATLSL
jgi:hypothetical protein